MMRRQGISRSCSSRGVGYSELQLSTQTRTSLPIISDWISDWINKSALSTVFGKAQSRTLLVIM